MHELFIRFSGDKLTQLAERIDTCAAQLSYDQIWWREAETQNAVGNLMLHLSGNLGQWILSGVGGAADTRHRDAEFAARGDASGEELRRRLQERVRDAVSVIRSLSAEQLTKKVKIQNYDTTVLEAVYHVVEHFAEHTGQVLYATKLLTRQDLGFYRHLNQPAHSEKTP